jgi:hypothetical protein
MYAQKLEGESWIGERMDPGKMEKMSGTYLHTCILGAFQGRLCLGD